MKYLGVLIMSIVCLKATADGHEKPDAGAEAMAMETAVCSFRDGKAYADFQKVVDKFKKWAADSNYSTYFVSNTPLYASPQAMPDVVLMEFSSFEGIATAWKKIWEDEPQFLESFEKTMCCSQPYALLSNAHQRRARTRRRPDYGCQLVYQKTRCYLGSIKQTASRILFWT